MTATEFAKILSDAQKQIDAESRRMGVALFHSYDDGERVYTSKPRRFRTVEATREAAREMLRECGGNVTITDRGVAVEL